VEGRVRFTEFVDEADLPALYRAATVFAYPSLYEGFGLPALEAMACGVPVVASNTSSLPEVVGEAGVLVDPLDVGELAAALDGLLADADRRDALREQGIARARTFTWTRAAEQTWDVYEEVLETRRHAGAKGTTRSSSP
jgi:glycosyltransferase involved in cell wall biosynthesis